MKILDIGKRIRIPIKSDINPGTNKKKPPIGVKIVFKKLSAVDSNEGFLDLISIRVLKP